MVEGILLIFKIEKTLEYLDLVEVELEITGIERWEENGTKGFDRERYLVTSKSRSRQRHWCGAPFLGMTNFQCSFCSKT